MRHESRIAATTRKLAWGRLLSYVTLGLLLVTANACQSQLADPPRLATAEAFQSAGSTAALEPLFLPAPTATPSSMTHQEPELMTAPSVAVWVNETSEEHRESLEMMAADFNQRTGIEVAFQFIDSGLLPSLARTAVISDTLPDLILHPLEFTATWSEEGILDPAAADAIIDQLGRETFDAGALDLVQVNGLTAAVPSDGYQQMLLYRSDWFAAKRLDVPDDYEAMISGAEALYDPENLVYGIVVPTESNLINTQRVFEHLALANNCRLIDESGEVQLLEPACRDALDFYYSIVNQFSPPGVQTDTSTRNAFLDGRTAMIISGPSILTDLVQSNRLDQNTGIITEIHGQNSVEQTANLGNISYMGITPVADKDAAAAFVNYWFNEGYQTWLAIESERKVPMRLGTKDRPRFYIDAWGTSPILQGESMEDIFGAQVVNQLREGIGSAERWGIQSGQGKLVGQLYEKLTLSVVLQEMLSGYFNSAKTLFEAYNRVIDLIPDYDFPIIPTPEA